MTSTPEPLPSLPPSPGPDPDPPKSRATPFGSGEDVARAWHDDEPSGSDRKALNSRRGKGKGTGRGKGKGKGRAGAGSDTDEEPDEEEDEDEDGAATGYPPTKEEEAETRRVQENLRRWEVAERQRRKAARESAALASAPASTAGVSTANSATSLFADIFRRDSRKASLGGVGTHQALSTRDRDGDDAMPLEEFDNPDVVSSPPTPEPENPFETPNASRTSLNIPGHSVIMTESDTLPDELTGAGSSRNLQVPVPHRPTLQASSSFATSEGTPEKKKKAPPPPQPLDLPPPRAPPPIDDTADTPGTDKQPQPVPTPSPEPPVREEENEQTRERERGRAEEKPPVKWWHEWLCGCGEGPDRGGDHQAGRTNPFE